MTKHTSELLQPEDMLSDTTHEGEIIYIPAKWKKKKKKEETFNTTWKVFSSKRENYSNTFAAVECGRMQNTEVEHRINKSENTEYVNWEDIRQKAAGHHRERQDMWLWLTHEVTDDLLKNHIQRTKDDYFRWTWKM